MDKRKMDVNDVRLDINYDGWICISKTNNNTILFTNAQILNETIDDKLQQQQDVINWQMEQIQSAIHLNAYNYENRYNELHGEGAYSRLYPNLDE